MKIEIDFYDGGYCYHPEFVAIKGGSRASVKFPAICAVIYHPVKGKILFDTGYSEHFYGATKKFPYSIYAKVTPVSIKKEDKLSFKLAEQNVETKDISYTILSHFHADHIGAVKEFDTSQFIYTESSYSAVKGKTGFKALLKGFLPDLLPENFEENSTQLAGPNKIQDHFLNDYFTTVYDIFGDRSIIGVEIPGHAKGQLGIYIETEEKKILLIADACYLSETFEEMKLPSNIIHIIGDSKEDYIDTVERIHKLYKDKKDITIVPSHCGRMFKQLVKKINWDTSDLNSCN